MLHFACKGGNFEIIKICVKLGFDVNAKTRDSQITPLLLACQYCTLEVVKYLVSHGAHLKHVTLLNEQPFENALYYAVAGGNLEIVDYLLQTKFFDLNERNCEGNTILYTAVQNGKLEVVKLLLQSHGALLHPDYSLLLAASKSSSVEVLNIVITTVNNFNNSLEGSCSIQSPLYYAVLFGMPLDGVIQLLQLGLNPLHLNEDNDTVLHVACTSGHTQVADHVLSKGIISTLDKNALQLAISNGNLELVKVLFKYGAVYCDSLNSLITNHYDICTYLFDSLSNQKDNLLVEACTNGHVDLVDFLLSKGANVNALINDFSPIYHATVNGHDLIVHKLLGAGATTTGTQKKQGKAKKKTHVHNLLNEALAIGSAYMYQTYKSLGVASNSVKTARDMITQLSNAVIDGHYEMSTLLFQELQQKKKLPPHELNSLLVSAIQYGKTYVAKFLLENGANPNHLEEGTHVLAYASSIADIHVLITFGATFTINNKDFKTDILDFSLAQGTSLNCFLYLETVGFNHVHEMDKTAELPMVR